MHFPVTEAERAGPPVPFSATPFPAPDDETGWRRRFHALAGLTIAIYLYLALFVPGTLTWATFTIQDDARQFMAWMPRLLDPGLLPGDRLADYWQDVSPWLYRLPFDAAAALGVDPILFGRLLPAPLLAVTAWMSWRVARHLTESPRAAFVAATFLFAFLAHEDSIYSATPRAISPVLLLVFIDAMFARRWAVMLPVLAVLGGVYPTTALLCLALLGIGHLHVHKPWIDLDWRTFALFVIAVAVIVGAALPLTSRTEGWGPALTLAEAMQLPNLAVPEARSTIVDEAGRIGWACSGRMGFLPEIVPCGRGVPLAWLANLLLLCPLLFLAGRAALGKPGWSGRTDRLYLDALIVAAVLFGVAATLAFALHLPSRYSQRLLGPLEWLATGQLIGTWLDRRLRAGSAGRGVRWAAGALTAFFAILYLSPTPGLRRAGDEAVMRRIAALPKDVRIAGVAEDLAMVPAVTGRSILASTEHAIPWHQHYRRLLDERLRDSVTLAASANLVQFAAAWDRGRPTHLLIERRVLETGAIPERYATIVPEAVAAAERSRGEARSIAATHAPACTVFADRLLVLLDAGCLMREAIGD